MITNRLNYMDAPEEIKVKSYLLMEAPEEMRSIADSYLEKFGSTFQTLTFFPKMLLSSLQEPPCNEKPAGIIGSEQLSVFAHEIDVLSEIANSEILDPEQNKVYYSKLIEIYRKFPKDIAKLVSSSDTLIVAPEREGSILARALGFLPENRSLCPQAKRMPYKGGIIVGLDINPPEEKFKKCIVVDGAIASGATLMAIISQLQSYVEEFEVFSIHCTRASLSVLSRFARANNVNLSVNVGHASGSLNEKYYAIDIEQGNRLIIGDIGDMISPVSP